MAKQFLISRKKSKKKCSLSHKIMHLRVEGFSLKFEVLNLTGFSFLSIYYSFGFFADDKGAGTVHIQKKICDFLRLILWILFLPIMLCLW